MIKITKTEANIVRKYFPHAHIRRTTNNYYMEENKKAMDFLKNCKEIPPTNKR